MAKTASFIFLLSVIFFFPTFSLSIRVPDLGPMRPAIARSPIENVDRLIRSLNLDPRDANDDAIGRGSEDLGKHIVEASSASGTSVKELGRHAGYFKLNHTHDARMFYFFFESRHNKEDPVVIWLTGGPGCSSELALFYENGPFTIAKNLSLEWNNFGWDQASNLIYVDQPTGTGFSYSSDKRDTRHSEKGVSNDLYDFLQAFFGEHPELVKNDFYITGESYAGHYIPAFASRVHKGNKDNEGIHINLKGFAIGNGLTDPAIQYASYTDFALEKGIIKRDEYESINKLIPGCEQTVKECGLYGNNSCSRALQVCGLIFGLSLRNAGNINVYDIRKQCEGELCYDFSNVEKFLNLQFVRDSLGIGRRKFVSCSGNVNEAMVTDHMKNLEPGIPELLEDGIKMLIYAGEYDFICNWLGNWRWVHAMKWSGQHAFASSANTSFIVDGVEAGVLKTRGPLSFLKVHNAGHMVPMDQPKAALEMLKRWMQGKLSNNFKWNFAM